MKNTGSCEIYPAFSRDQPEKIYVQDVMWQNRDEMFRLIDKEGSYVLIAGNSKRMPEDVSAFLEKIISYGLLNEKQADNSEHSNSIAKEYVRSMEAQRRIQLETWS